MSSRADTLNLLLSYLKEAGPYVLASAEDAEFFRKINKPAPKVEVIPTPPPKTFSPPPPPPPAPAPKIKVEAPLPPPKMEAKPEPLQKPILDFSGVRNVLSVAAPELAIINEIPNDAIARKIAEKWKTKNQSAPISLLCLHEPEEQRALLEQVAKALDIYFGPAKIVHAETIEKENQWEAFLSVADLKLIIICDYTLWQLKNLMHFYKETPAQGIRMLKNTPLLLLPDLSLYLKDPQLKRSLWKALCQKCS